MGTSTRMVQLANPGFGRRVALVDGGELHLLGTYRSVYAFAVAALETGYRLRDLLSTDLSGIALDYRKVWALETEWRVLPSFDHPVEPARCLVSSVALADEAGGNRETTWVFKGRGEALRGHGEALIAPWFAASAGESAAVAAAYIVDAEGMPRRIGLTAGNELCDPERAARGGAALAESKLRPCSIGPELWLDAEFEEIRGTVSVRRRGVELWSAELAAGDRLGGYGLRPIEGRLFRHAGHRRPGDAHVYFLGPVGTSYAAGVRLEDGDETVIAWEGFGLPLVNSVHREREGSRGTAIPL